MDFEKELEKRDKMIKELREEYNLIFMENGNLIKQNNYYRRRLKSQERLQRKAHVYKVEMNRLRRKLERIYYYLGHCEYRRVYSELEQEMVVSWKDMVNLSEAAAEKVIEFYKSL